MPYLSYLFIFIGAVALIALLSVVVTRMRNKRHLEAMRTAVEDSKYAEKKPLVRPKVMKGAQPVVGIKVLKRSDIVGSAEAAPETKAAEAEPSVPPVEAEAAPFVPCPYPPFSNARAVEVLGLSQAEADAFIVELIAQIEEEMPALEAAVAAQDMVQIEEISHKLKGSASSLGEGGIADLLSDFNTCAKEKDERDALDEYAANLRYYLAELKEAFPA